MNFRHIVHLVLAVSFTVTLPIACDKDGGDENETPSLGECALDPDYTDVEYVVEGSFTHVNGFLGQAEHDRRGQVGVVTALVMQLVPQSGGSRVFAIRSISSSGQVGLRSIEIHLQDGAVIEPAETCEFTPSRDALACPFTELDMMRLATDCQPTVRVDSSDGEPFDFQLDESQRALVQGVIEPHQPM